jgi:hypothetical protein
VRFSLWSRPSANGWDGAGTTQRWDECEGVHATAAKDSNHVRRLQGVVPRRPEFRRKLSTVSQLQILGVQVGPEVVRLHLPSPDSEGLSPRMGQSNELRRC